MAVKSRLRAWADRQAKLAGRVEEVVAGVILTRGMMLAPRDTGALIANGRTYRDSQGHWVTKFGDNDVPYARIQELGGVTGRNQSTNIQGTHYLKRAGDSVKKENIKKYVDMSL
jgi:phage gpG-like protein